MLNTIGSIATTFFNNALASEREKNARQENFAYGEKSADNADARTRALYEDYYSPSAQVSQLKEAGLSPSLFFGGNSTSGMSVQGAQGTGASGVNPNTYFIDPLTAAQIDNIKADTELKRENTTGQGILNSIKDMEKKIFENEFDFLHGIIWNEDGSSYSIAEMANTCNNFEDFLKDVRNAQEKAGYITDFNTKQVLLLQDYFNTYKRMNTEIEQLKFNSEDAKMNKDIVSALAKIDYANLNAEQIRHQLNATIEQAKLDEEQKKAWNNVINSIDNENVRGAVIVISMILDRMASVYRTTPNITLHKNRQIRTNE